MESYGCWIHPATTIRCISRPCCTHLTPALSTSSTTAHKTPARILALGSPSRPRPSRTEKSLLELPPACLHLDSFAHLGATGARMWIRQPTQEVSASQQAPARARGARQPRRT